MAKVAKIKKRETSVHSRAHRRAASPERTLNNNKPKPISKTKDDENNDSWIYAAQSTNGVHKKAPKAKKLTRQQRQRQLKALEHADRNVDKLEKKVADSKRRSGKVQARRAEWEDVNGVKTAVGEGKAVKAPEDGKAGAMEGVEEEPVERPAAGLAGVDGTTAQSGAHVLLDENAEPEVSASAVDNDIDDIG